jgi:tetratricopeptide (TPR) repeat protein
VAISNEKMSSKFRLAITASLLLATLPAFAAIGFVSGTKVSRVGDLAVITVSFNCNVAYLGHEPRGIGSQLRLQLEPTSVCTGVSPLAAITQERHRPASADLAKLIDIEYDGESSAETLLRFNFSEDVSFGIEPFTSARHVIVRVNLNPKQNSAAAPVSRQVSRRVQRPQPPPARYAINLQSSERPPATADFPVLDLRGGLQLMVTEVVIDGKTWHRLRVGYYDSSDAAARALATLRNEFPTAWIDRESPGFVPTPGIAPIVEPVVESDVEQLLEANGVAEQVSIAPGADAKLVELMAEGRRLMTAGELSRAVQIYTKILQQPTNQYQPEAQEYLALARERNGQMAHAKAEYQRYLATYPDHEGAARVKQRLAALLSQPGRSQTETVASGNGLRTTRRRPDTWTVRSYISQYYRRDANQLNDAAQVVSQSALYSDINIDARRRGERFDFSTRLTAGYRKNFLEDQRGDDVRISYAFVDLADAKYGLRGRLGRQSRNTGGVLGRFDGGNLSYQATNRLRFDAVVGKPVNSTTDGIDSARTFYGISSSFGPILDNLDFGVFFIQQDVESVTDRQAVGAEVRYFGSNKSLWGLVDYDTSFDEIGSLFLQGSWRMASELTLTGLFDRRRSPRLSMSNALIGQPVLGFDDLLILYTEPEIQQLALDRAAMTTTMTLGVSRPLTPKIQINVNASQSTIDATPESGGIFATPESTYTYISTDFVGSSLIKEGDVTLLGLRYADSENTTVYSIHLDTRFPIGSYFRFNPRLRVDYREIKSDMSTHTIYTPGIRLQYRKDRRFRVELEAGMQFSSRDMAILTEDRESYFVNLGYQLLF